MNVLKQSNKDILLLLGNNPYFKNKKYRLNKYCFIHNYEGVKLILNEMTRSIISMTEEEFERIYDIENAYSDPTLEYVEFMIENYFLVFEDFDEAKVTDEIRKHLRPKIDDNYLKECYDFVIFPTTTCNARCFYCYEKPMGEKKAMTIEMAERVVKYMMKKAPNKKNNIILRWFGGEPLFNMKVMRHIINRLKDEGYSYTSSIISNGYLFSDKIVEEAVNEWKLNHVQITLDGTEEVYNKAKNYIYTNQDTVSPFKKVIDNIERLTNNGVNVTIRMNTDMYNADDLMNLVRYLNERFPEHKNLGCYPYPIFDDEENPRTDEEKKLLFDKILEVENVMKECGFIEGSEDINGHIRITHCMVDNGNTINIHVDGTLGVCEHYINSDNWGYIDEDSNEVRTEWKNVEDWRNYVTDDFCKNCPIYPTCLRVSKCQDLKSCDQYFQEFRLRHERTNMEGVYKGYIRKQNNSLCSINENNKMKNGGCYCISQVCGDYEQTSNQNDGCYCVTQRCGDNEQTQNQNGECYCVTQRCEDKENWCYCISQKQEVEEHKCEGGTCTCKKEEKNIDETPKQVEEVKEKESWYKRILNIFK